MKNRVARFGIATVLAVFVIFFAVKCPTPTTNFTTQTQDVSKTITVTSGGVSTRFGLDTATISGTTASSNINGTTMAANATCTVTGMSIRGRYTSMSNSTGVVGDQPIQVDLVTPAPDAAKPKQ